MTSMSLPTTRVLLDRWTGQTMVDHELARVDSYLRFGSDNNLVHSRRHSSITGLIRFGANRDNSRAPTFTPLECVTNLWKCLEDRPNSQQDLCCNRIQQLIANCVQSGHLRPHCLPLLMASLMTCQKPKTDQSPFRALAISLFVKPYVHPVDVLMFAAIIGYKRLNSNNQFRHCFRLYYRRQDITHKDIEDNLVFGRKFGWSHKDIIRLCHAKVTPMTEQLMGYKKWSTTEADGDRQLTPIERRVRAFRTLKRSRVHEIVAALDTTCLDPSDWFHALNTIWMNEPIVWRKVIQSLAVGDQLLAAVPYVFSKFPNNETLFRDLFASLQRINRQTFSSNFVKHLVLYYCERNVLSLKTQVLPQLATFLTDKLVIDYQYNQPILVVIDKGMDLNDKYLRSLKKNKKYLKTDVMDSMALKDIIWLFLRSFRCNLSIGGHILPIDQLDSQSIQSLDELSVTDVLSRRKWSRRVLYISDKQLDTRLWVQNMDQKLVVLHLNRIQLKRLAEYQSNVLILNGFDVKLEAIITNFFG